MSLSTRFITEQDREKIRLAVKLHTPVEVISYTLPREKEMFIQEVLLAFLSECHQEHMADNLMFCLGELLTNAKKANTKRVYFKEQNLDINNEMDYHQGMVSFKDDMLSNLEYYLKKQKKAGLYVKLILQLYDEGLKIEIRNNSLLTVFERKRINEKLRIANKYNDPKQVIAKVIDQTEGAGLGIIIMVLMLRKIGMSSDNYKVFSTDSETITQMILPLNAEINRQMDLLYEEFVDSLKIIPVFEENLKELKTIAASGTADDQATLDYISRDVFMSSVVLKQAAEKGHSCSRITEAYEFLGKETVLSLLSEENPQIRIMKKSTGLCDFWNHEYDVAFYAYNLTRNFIQDKIDLEEVYVCGLFHDIECLLLEVATQEQKDTIKKLADSLDNTGLLFSLFEKDFGHSRGCYMLAKKWGLPEKIAHVILYHNNPDGAPDDYKQLVYIVYLADILQYYQKDEVAFCQINEKVLEYFGIDSERRLKGIVKKINAVLRQDH